MTNGVADGSSCAGVDLEAGLGFPVDVDLFFGLLLEVCSLVLAAAWLSVAALFSWTFRLLAVGSSSVAVEL